VRSQVPESIPSCPDLPALMVMLEQSETLMNLLRRERAAWSDPAWTALMRKGGTPGERALEVAQATLERAAEVESIEPDDLFLYGAALRGQLKRVLGNSALVRILGRPHVSLADLLNRGSVRLLSVNLNGAYRTAVPRTVKMISHGSGTASTCSGRCGRFRSKGSARPDGIWKEVSRLKPASVGRTPCS
jgi:hypothetical protein